MKVLSITEILCILLFCGCGGQDEESLIDGDGYFALYNLDMPVDMHILDAALIEIPYCGTRMGMIIDLKPVTWIGRSSWTDCIWGSSIILCSQCLRSVI